MTNLIEWISDWIDFPPQFEFISYLAAAVILLILIIVTLDFFVSISFAIFGKRR